MLDAAIGAVEAEITASAARSAHGAMLQASLASMFVRAANNLDLPDVTIIDGERVRVRPTTALIRSMMRDRLSREEAVNRAVRRSWENNRNEPKMREELGRRFDGLDLEERRNLV